MNWLVVQPVTPKLSCSDLSLSLKLLYYYYYWAIRTYSIFLRHLCASLAVSAVIPKKWKAEPSLLSFKTFSVPFLTFLFLYLVTWMVFSSIFPFPSALCAVTELPPNNFFYIYTCKSVRQAYLIKLQLAFCQTNGIKVFTLQMQHHPPHEKKSLHLLRGQGNCL